METENEVRGKVEEAHSEAQKIVRTAESGSRDIIETRRQNAIREGQALIERLTAEAEQERSQQISKVKGGSTEVLKKRSGEIEKAVSQIIEMVAGKEQK